MAVRLRVGSQSETKKLVLDCGRPPHGSRYPVSQSMSGTGNCFDNAVAESFFASLKKERLHHTVFATWTEAYDTVERYIDGFYNPTRRHSLLGYVSPLSYESAGGRCRSLILA